VWLVQPSKKIDNWDDFESRDRHIIIAAARHDELE
jgi:hypothetical protein